MWGAPQCWPLGGNRSRGSTPVWFGWRGLFVDGYAVRRRGMMNERVGPWKQARKSDHDRHPAVIPVMESHMVGSPNAPTKSDVALPSEATRAQPMAIFMEADRASGESPREATHATIQIDAQTIPLSIHPNRNPCVSSSRIFISYPFQE